ncbi:MAG TPA: protein kinase, partial [Thermoanaerobaculia bacterium]|nr:protein kinase [Thermoanaerobaculia bacterium]
ARTISQLSHPNICTLFDVGDNYLVMELLEGETLADRLAHGPLPLHEVLTYGAQLADALGLAHAAGVVHRDLKPGNIMITKSGAKLLDFGLAKVEQAPLIDVEGATQQKPLTREGTILGTFQYMAPEQLEGEEADARTDIFALGAVLYEMATGRKPFAGKSQASLIAAILDATPPPVSSLSPMTPPALDRVVKTCLEKDPDDRFQTAHDVRLQLEWIAEGGSQAGVAAPVAARRKSRERTAWTVAAVLALATAGRAVAYLRPDTSIAQRVVRSTILPPETNVYRFVGIGAGPVAVSPDGLALTFVATDASEKSVLWVRPLDTSIARALPGTDGASYPFWSPDSRFLGFFAGGKLKKIDVAGGPPSTICDAADARGGTWSRDGVIVFEPHFRLPLSRVAATGGKVSPVTSLDSARKETTHRWPHFLPDGKHFLYFSGSHSTGPESELDAIFVGSLDGAERPKLLVNARSQGIYAAGRLLFARQNTLLAQPFDVATLTLEGNAVPIAEKIQDDPGFFNAAFSASDRVLAYQESGGTAGFSELVWFDRTGKKLESVGEPADYWNPRLASDGRRVAFGIGDPGDLWIHDLSRRVRTRLTFNPADDFAPIWSPDGTRIVFSSQRSGAGDLYWKLASGTGEEELLETSMRFKVPGSWSPDGRVVAFYDFSQGHPDIWLLSVSDRKKTRLMQGDFEKGNPEFSPDGRWLAYTSSESGRFEIYVQPFPGPGGKWQVSSGGGQTPEWRSDGRELFYMSLDGKLMSVDVRAGSSFETGEPRVLFAVRPKSSPERQFAASKDGQRFLVNVPSSGQQSPPITLVQDWPAALGP